jgi:uncharacterized membrane protein YcjF (UPF0283 family)
MFRLLEELLERATNGPSVMTFVRLAAALLLALEAFQSADLLSIGGSHLVLVGVLFAVGFVLAELVALLSNLSSVWTLRASERGTHPKRRRREIREAYAEDVLRAKRKALEAAQLSGGRK